jgi:capsular exopolysaccharide synthesis family protein
MNTERRGPGVSNVLSDPNVSLSDAICKTNVEGVHVLPAGSGPPNPAELLGSPKMAESLNQLKAEYDFVFVDSPPLLVCSDGSILAAQADMALVVVEGNATRSSALRSALDILRSTQVHVAGVIVNKFTRSRFGYGYSYPYYSNYRYYTESEDVPVNRAGRFYKGISQRAVGAWARLRMRDK